jgi:hypothetical protein
MLNLTDEEHKALVKAAGGKSAAAFARSVVLRYLARRRWLSYSQGGDEGARSPKELNLPAISDTRFT